MKELGYLLYGLYLLLTAWLVVSGLVQLHLLLLSKKKQIKYGDGKRSKMPFVSIQVPVYNESYTADGLLDALAALHYSKEHYEVWVLDDSTDETVHFIDRKVAALKEQGLAIHIARRRDRKGYKAGALQENLAQCKGEFITLFDADFRPQPDFLLRLLPSFSDPSVGLVQARWGHLNRQQNFLTRIQSFLLDTFFSIEQRGRQQGGYFTNFCGTAGTWRKACLEDAGGWDGTVLSEDLDLSYKAQLKGWKVVYNHGIEVPAELPSTFEAFTIQQRRWTKGMMQVFLRNRSRIAKSGLAFDKKLHALFHLSGSFVFPCLLVNSVLCLPLLLLRQAYPEFIMLTNIAAFGGVNLLFITLVFYNGTKEQKQGSFWTYYPLFLSVYMGMAVQNSLGVFEAILGRRSAFIRTPKTAAATTTEGSADRRTTHLIEVFFFLYFVLGILLSIRFGDYFYLLLFLMMTAGLGIILASTLPWRTLRCPISFPKFGWRESMLPGDGR